MSLWFARRIIDLVGALYDLFNERRFGTLTPHLGQPDLESDRDRRFIIIQIDGLAYDYLRQAIETGYMPHLARLEAGGELEISAWRSGLPSTTPAFQAGMMFGNRYDIPGFRWYEKDRERAVVVKRPDQARELRERVSDGRRGILEGGSCYVSIFDGDASVALFTLSALAQQRFFESVKGLGLLLLFLGSPLRLLKVVGLTLSQYLRSLVRRIRVLLRPSRFEPFDRPSLFTAFSDALFIETQTFCVVLDIYRQAPAIYANYNNYDEAAHKSGSGDRVAFRQLRAIDKRIRQIDRMRKRYPDRQYDLYVLSDHGNTPAATFSRQTGRSLAQYIRERIGDPQGPGGEPNARIDAPDKMPYLSRELEQLADVASPRLCRALRIIRRFMEERALRGAGALGERVADYDMRRQRDVVVRASGSLAHVYFNVASRPLDLIEVMVMYPRLIDDLLMTAGIGALIGRAGGRTIVFGRQGGSMVIGDDLQTLALESPHPLTSFGAADYVTAQVHQLVHFPHAGDVVILGAVDDRGAVVTFEEQAATHGAVGGVQDRPFIARPPGAPPLPSPLDDPLALYPYFRRYLDGPSEPLVAE